MMYERYEQVPSRNTDDSFADQWFRPLVYKRLGELYEEKGDAAQAAANYRQFIALWQNAEPELQPLVTDARRRLAKLSPDR